MKDKLQDILFQKYQDKTLASLYIANYASSSIDPKIWVQNFIEQFTKVSDHPDILKINKAEKETEYKVDSKQIRELFHFINYKPLQLEKKFIFIFDAQDISNILSNKLLKIFEELNSHFCLILMVLDNAYMLPTVLSRAIKLQIPNQLSEVVDEKHDFSKINTPQELIAHLKQSNEKRSGAELEKFFIDQRIQQILSNTRADSASYQKLDQLLMALKENETYNNFSNSKLPRLARFFA